MKHIDFLILDMLCLHGSFVLAFIARHGWATQPYSLPTYRNLAIMMTIVNMVVAVLFDSTENIYRRGWYAELIQTVRHVLVVFGVLTIYMFSRKTGEEYSRIVMYLMMAVYGCTGYCVRQLWKRCSRSRFMKRHRRSMLIVTDAASAEKQVRQLKEAPNEIFHIAGVVLTDGTATEIAGVPVVAEVDSAADYICREWVDEVFFCDDVQSAASQTLLRQCREMGLVTHQALSLKDSMGQRQFVEKVGGRQVLTSSVNYATPLQAAVKRAMDIVGAVVGLILTFFVVLIVGPMIKRESPGPVFFRQERIGRNGKRFRMIKIRSMYMDAEERKQALMKENRVADGLMFKLDFDPRIIGNRILPDGTRKTGIGTFIRKTSLDEFPQFWNVLKGEMSLVGTRPPTVDEWEKYDLHHRARLAVKPGITGMWQVSGRSDITDFEKVVELDTEYISNWSIALDIRILFRTVSVLFRKDGAM